ncbi:Protein of unknown function [Pyronema omphalodes CBS 100304]|uniref:Uncharacterized protein n=1 Tax=Pyronema omphalodes (strain CBS 100304) TaxID=1076935 RepID=U4KW94_PYROM|nr:Protein of unknown function [Pyronema omphalodes CBS 100304]
MRYCGVLKLGTREQDKLKFKAKKNPKQSCARIKVRQSNGTES